MIIKPVNSSISPILPESTSNGISKIRKKNLEAKEVLEKKQAVINDLNKSLTTLNPDSGDVVKKGIDQLKSLSRQIYSLKMMSNSAKDNSVQVKNLEKDFKYESKRLRSLIQELKVGVKKSTIFDESF